MSSSRRTSPTWRERFDSLETADDQIDFQTDYPMFDLNEFARILRSWLQDRKDDIISYRNATYRSVMTGTMAAQHHTEWVNELDSSLECYLNEPESDEVRDIWEGREAVQRR